MGYDHIGAELHHRSLPTRMVHHDQMGTASALSLEPYTLYLTPCALCLSAISLLALRHVYPVKFEDHLTGAPGLEPLHQRTVTNREAIFLDILRR